MTEAPKIHNQFQGKAAVILDTRSPVLSKYMVCRNSRRQLEEYEIEGLRLVGLEAAGMTLEGVVPLAAQFLHVSVSGKITVKVRMPA